ncbi:heme utilization cystosolic carrier protein HutX [Reinekea blandensis]|uniref:Heme iron utilization protein n=1 Tax=Reinekea blandensis MED297 TaxID=314283 RepID=A4BG02_9GAMM|nr:heme utilization cystosolic carrier protein HutX [Reinekea blandensis]EAR09020.1 hypothetical protein MED297_03987 [Reinekea sp. MED297] [Reinekea blandensis MED297]
MTTIDTTQSTTLPGAQAESLLKQIAGWGPVTTIVIHLGSVFEFKGPFPDGSVGHGFYNLNGPVPGFHGHLNLGDVDHIAFQTKPHRGRESYALVFNNRNGDTIFKIFLGRDDQGELLAHQKAAFFELMQDENSQ